MSISKMALKLTQRRLKILVLQGSYLNLRSDRQSRFAPAEYDVIKSPITLTTLIQPNAILLIQM